MSYVQSKIISNVQGVLPIANGGTNSGTALNNNRFIVSSGGAIGEAAAVTASRVVVSDTNGLPTASSTTTTQVQYLNAATGTTGTTSTNIVFSTTPTLVTPKVDTINENTSTNGVSIMGRSSGTAISFGYIGEIVTNSGSGIGPNTSGNFINVASVTLGAGRWAISGRGTLSPGSISGLTFMSTVISLTTASGTPVDNFGINRIVAATGQNNLQPVGPTYYINTVGGTTVYLNVAVYYGTVGTALVGGDIQAMRFS